MRASVLTGPKTSRVMEVLEPQITRASQIKIKILVCGLCNSEADIWGEYDGPGEIIGHEPVGIVVEKGKDVTEFQVGDRVAAGFCHHCFAEYTVQEASLFAKVPEEIPDEEAIGEPPSCMLGVVNRIPVSVGDRVAVVGCGYMGLLLLSFLKMKGCQCLTAVDNRREALKQALQFGADEVFTPEELRKEHFVNGFNERTFLDGFDKVFEVTGNEQALNMAARMVKGHGWLVITGFHTGMRNVDMKLWNIKGLNVINGHDKRLDMRGSYIRILMELMEARRFSSRGLMTHEFSLEEVDQGFFAMLGRKDGYTKGYVRIGKKEGETRNENQSMC